MDDCDIVCFFTVTVNVNLGRALLWCSNRSFASEVGVFLQCRLNGSSALLLYVSRVLQRMEFSRLWLLLSCIVVMIVVVVVMTTGGCRWEATTGEGSTRSWGWSHQQHRQWS